MAVSLTAGIDASDAGVVELFERGRDIPFAFTPHHDPETLLTTGSGTCSPKHTLLARLYGGLGLETRFVYVTFRFDDMPGDFPPELRALVHDGVVRAHAALQLRRPQGWIDVDATFDRPRARAGRTRLDATHGAGTRACGVRAWLQSQRGPRTP